MAAALTLVALLGYWWPAALPALLAADLLWLLALAVDAWRAPDPVELDVTREAPPAFSLGRAQPVRYRWHLRSRQPSELIIRESWPAPLGGDSVPERQLQMHPGVDRSETVTVHPQSRGLAEGGTLAFRLSGPWGLAWRQAKRPLPWRAIVYPKLEGASVRSLPAQSARRRDVGLRQMRWRGEGRLVEGLREWVQGDDIRSIDWKATARRGKLIARQYEDERRQPVLLVIDAGRLLTAEVDGRARLEAVIDAAVHLAYAAVEHDDDVGVFIFADKVQRFVPPGRGRRALRSVLDALAVTEGKLVEPDYTGAFRRLAVENRKRALVVLFTDVIDKTASEAFVVQAGRLRPRHLPVAVTLRNPALERMAVKRPVSTTEAVERAAAEELLLAREEALAEMRRQGVVIVDVPPESAAASVVESYHQLKRRGLL